VRFINTSVRGSAPQVPGLILSQLSADFVRVNDIDKAIRLTDVRIAVDFATEGMAVLTEEAIIVNGETLSNEWREKAAAAPDAMKVLVNPGDRVRVEGDEDAPDRIYVVGEVDNADVDKRVYVESDEDYFGFVANTSIKEIIRE
jgi:hypothetical protein